MVGSVSQQSAIALAARVAEVSEHLPALSQTDALLAELVQWQQDHRLLLEQTDTFASQWLASEHTHSHPFGLRLFQPSVILLDVFRRMPLNSPIGRVVLELAEALGRLDDAGTAAALLQDKASMVVAACQQGSDDQSQFVASKPLTRAVSLVGLMPLLKALSASKCLCRLALPWVKWGIGQFASQFVFAQNIAQALIRQGQLPSALSSVSLDCLGEAAQTTGDADRFYRSYLAAIEAIDCAHQRRRCTDQERQKLAVSIKLSALHPRFSGLKVDALDQELMPKVIRLARAAAQADIGFTLDAEDCQYLEITLAVLVALLHLREFSNWQGLGIAVQAYQPRALAVLQYLRECNQHRNVPLSVRLVKGAYWDSEIKRAQQLGLDHYPVFTQKSHTDANYCRCAQYMADHREDFYGQFASHNPNTLAFVFGQYQGHDSDFEIQMLQGMGESLARAIVDSQPSIRVRRYAPVGRTRELLPYLLRRLIENGANTSIWRAQELPTPPASESAAQEPAALEPAALPIALPLPCDLYRYSSDAPRDNSRGWDTSQYVFYQHVSLGMAIGQNKGNEGSNRESNREGNGKNNGKSDEENNVKSNEECKREAQALALALLTQPCTGTCDTLSEAVTTFRSEAACHHNTGERRQRVLAFAHALSTHTLELIRILQDEAGKTLNDALSEVREAIEFCHYYVACSEVQGHAGQLQSHTASRSEPLALCISPWNFPLAIFCGQWLAAYLAGFKVMVKASAHTPKIAYAALNLARGVGIEDHEVLLLEVSGVKLAKQLAQVDVQAVLFTGSNASAKSIQASLLSAAQYYGRLPAKFIAETGGINGLLVEGSAHLQQVVDIILESAFGSAGQRCSALRIALIQEDIFQTLCQRLVKAAGLLSVGNPLIVSTDIGPIISRNDRDGLLEKIHRLEHQLNTQVWLASEMIDQEGRAYLTPGVVQLDSVAQLTEEIFGSYLCVVSVPRDEFSDHLHQLQAKGYGLTLGLASRNQTWLDAMCDQAVAGNIYINRSMTGAVVGVQPFGGCGLSGTGPKAGGPNYLNHLLGCLNEKVIQGMATGFAKSTVLSGPTGECNLLRYRPRGKLLYIATSNLNVEVLKRLITAGNRVSILCIESIESIENIGETGSDDVQTYNANAVETSAIETLINESLIQYPKKLTVIDDSEINSKQALKLHMDDVSAVIIASECLDNTTFKPESTEAFPSLLKAIYDDLEARAEIVPVVSDEHASHVSFWEQTISTNTSAVGGDWELLSK